MTVNLFSELQKFCGHSRRLRTIFEDTKKCFGEINLSGNFDGTQLITAELLKEEETEIVQTVHKSPTFVIFGQNPYVKSRILNELFGRAIMPTQDLEAFGTSHMHMVRFKQENNQINQMLPEDFGLWESTDTDPDTWSTISIQDLVVCDMADASKEDNAEELACLEVTLNHPLLRFGTQVVVAPSSPDGLTEEDVKLCIGHTPTVLLFGFASDHLNDKDVQDLGEIGKVTSFQPVSFLRVPPLGSRTVDTDPPDGSRQGGRLGDSSVQSKSLARTFRLAHSLDSGCGSGRSFAMRSSTEVHAPTVSLSQQLCRLGYLPGAEHETQQLRALSQDYYMVESIYIEQFQEFLPAFSRFAQQTFQSYLVNASTILNNSHTRCLKLFILSAFDMSRDITITPRKLEFAQTKEAELYKALMALAVSKINEIKDFVAEAIIDISMGVQGEAVRFDFAVHGIDVENGKLSAGKIKQCTEKIQEMVLARLNSHVAGKLLNSVNVLRDSYTGTLRRCLESLEGQTNCPQDVRTTDALKQILNAAYQVEITVHSSTSFIKTLLEKMKQMMMSMPWKSPPEVNSEWKKKVASDMLCSLNESRLAKSIAGQIKERLNQSHMAFAAALKQLELRQHGRLDHIEGQRVKLRKVHAPRLAKLALDSTSLRDIVMYGMPAMGREIGRGQYGVVYSCDTWAGFSPVAVKSVVPPDDRHWNDLALEFFYTKNIPEHPRVVTVRGSVIDYVYGGGMTPAVLLVMDRQQRDLYTALKQGLEWYHRLQVARDVVDGLRFLHNQGLIHRDVKLKNVLLDTELRGKITDLGFCKPEAMMSGSIVGTPIHMAPELFSGHYDNSVDVYAFGILFWYVCAGHVHLPTSFEQCASKDQLWQSVRNGLRPERLPAFSEQCWQLMKQCWYGEPAKRPFFGDVETVLRSIQDTVNRPNADPESSGKSPSSAGKSRNIKYLESRRIPARRR